MDVRLLGAFDVTLEAAAQRSGSLGAMGFTVPFIMDAATGHERAVVLDTAPAALKVIWYLARGRHARLTAKAFAP